MSDARMIGRVSPGQLTERIIALRAQHAGERSGPEITATRIALLDARDTLGAIYADNAAFLAKTTGISEEIRKRRAIQCHLKASVDHINSILNAKRIGP